MGWLSNALEQSRDLRCVTCMHKYPPGYKWKAQFRICDRCLAKGITEPNLRRPLRFPEDRIEAVVGCLLVLICFFPGPAIVYVAGYPVLGIVLVVVGLALGVVPGSSRVYEGPGASGVDDDGC